MGRRGRRAGVSFAPCGDDGQVRGKVENLVRRMGGNTYDGPFSKRSPSRYRQPSILGPTQPFLGGDAKQGFDHVRGERAFGDYIQLSLSYFGTLRGLAFAQGGKVAVCSGGGMHLLGANGEIPPGDSDVPPLWQHGCPCCVMTQAG
jgi:hypothetical protein